MSQLYCISAPNGMRFACHDMPLKGWGWNGGWDDAESHVVTFPSVLAAVRFMGVKSMFDSCIAEPFVPTELDPLARGVLKDLAGAGALADWLQEHDREKEAVLLRRRWRSWEKERTYSVAEVLIKAGRYGQNKEWAECRTEQLHQRADRSFTHYIKSRFLPRKRPVPPAPHTCQRPRTCCCSVSGLEPSEDCPVHSGGEWPPRCEVCGRLMKYLQVSQEAA